MSARASQDAEVLVVGGGPAGATAARALAIRGIRVLLLDRSRFPRNKPCGGGITLRVLRRFPYLEHPLGRISTHYVSRLYLEGPSGGAVTYQSPKPTILLIRRVEFDGLLVDLAREAGAVLVDGADITQAAQDADGVTLHARDGRTFRAPWVIAADGVNSVVARRLGLNPGWDHGAVALDMMEETPVASLRSSNPDTLWVYYGYGGSHGYAYVFPKRAHVNVGIGYVLAYFKARVDEAPYALQQQFVGDLRARGMLEGNSDPDRFTPFLLPVGGPLARTADRRVLLAGDAGGFVNGFTAEGIYFAMVTGELAAAALSHQEPAASYMRMWRREIGAELSNSVVLRRAAFRSSRRADDLVTAANRSPAALELVARYARGDVSYAAARRRFLLMFPLVGFRLAVESCKKALGSWH